MQFSIEVLPAPFGPMIENNSPLATAKLTPLSALKPPKRKCTSSTRSNVVAAAAAMISPLPPCPVLPRGTRLYHARPRACQPPVGLQLGHPGLGAVLVLLAGAAADAAGAQHLVAADDRHRTLAEDHVVALVAADADEGRVRAALGQLAGGPAKG